MAIGFDPSQHQSKPESGNSDRVAVLLTGYGEVEDYKDLTTYNKRASFYIAAKFAPIPQWLYPLVARVLTLQNLFEWGYQHHHFTSPQNEIFEQQRLGIEQQLQEKWGISEVVPGKPRVQVFKAFYFCEPFLESVLRQIEQQGFDRLLVYPLLVVNSIFTSSIAVEQVNQAIDKLTPGEARWLKRLRYIPSFAHELAYIDLMARQVAEEISQVLATSLTPSQIGVVLTVHGGPEKSKGLITGAEEGQLLYDQVQARLINQYPLVSIGWINHEIPLVKWSEPNLKQAAKNLIELGAKAIVFKPIGWATENYETLIEVEEVIESLQRQHPDLSYIRMRCANDHPDFLKMAAAWAHPHIAALLSDLDPSAAINDITQNKLRVE